MNKIGIWALATLMSAVGSVALAQSASPPPPQGSSQGTAVQHTAESLAASVTRAQVALPAKLTGTTTYLGKWAEMPSPAVAAKVPLVLFLHGSSGLGLAAIGEWQKWLAEQGIASVAPDSFAVPDRLTYKSPIDKAIYEQIHALRASEVAPTLTALKQLPWVDAGRLVLAGTSEGAVPVARYKGTDFAARMLFAWSCESNYFVQEPQNAFEMDKPVLNIISMTDPFFSQSNSWLGNPMAKGHCAAALKDNKRAAVVLIPDAPHTLLNLPAARHAVAGFLADALK